MQAELPHIAAQKEDTDKVKKSAGKSKKPKAEEEAKKPKAEDDGIAAALLAAKSKMLNINSFWSGFEVFAADKHMPSDELLANVAELIQDGALQVVVDSVHELRDLDKAHQVVESFHAAGKV
jgi:NADPH:quinone reductase-like Zn-dependent oxidoreductase